MTTIESAATAQFRVKSLFAALIAVFSAGLAGCETGASLFGSSSGDNGASIAANAPVAPAATAPAKIVVKTVFGPSETVGKSLHAQMVSAIERQKITVAKSPAETAEYELRGYIISSKEKTSTKFSYVWDVTDPAGKRLNRIAGEETAPSASGRDPWAAITPQIGEKIASKTAANLASWLPTVAGASGGPNSGSVPSANVPMASTSPNGGAPTTTAAIPAATPAGSTMPPPTATATGSIGRTGAIEAIVPNVQGAPGGGSLELTNAIQRELSKSGVTLSQVGGQAYRVEGRVIVGQVSGGKQPIEIEWQVKDPAGKKLGTVSQKNTIDAGSLDGPWGKIADVVAEAAVKRIVELLPSSSKQAKAG